MTKAEKEKGTKAASGKAVKAHSHGPVKAGELLEAAGASATETPKRPRGRPSKTVAGQQEQSEQDKPGVRNYVVAGPSVGQPLSAKIEKLGNLQKAKRKPKKPVPFPVVLFDDRLVISNPLARSALFSASNVRQFYTRFTPICTAAGWKIEIFGSTLDQYDHQVYLSLISLAQEQDWGDRVGASTRRILGEMGLHNGKSQREQLNASLSRLLTSTIKIVGSRGESCAGSLIDFLVLPADQQDLPEKDRWIGFRLNPEFADLYMAANCSLVKAEDRRKLHGPGYMLALWLHAWLAGHEKPYPTKLETLQALSGITDVKRNFRGLLRKALEMLQRNGTVKDWHIDVSDKVYITKL